MNPSQSVPEGVETVTAEGNDLSLAIAAAAESIGVDPKRVEFKFDMSHFRSNMGTSVAKRTVKIIAWNTSKSDEELEAEAAKTESKKPRKARSRDRDESNEDKGEPRERRSRSRRNDDRRDDRKDEREERPAPGDLEDNEASTFAREWFVALLEKMGIEGEVQSGGTDDRVQLWVKAERAGRLIGKKGSTLGAIRHLLGIMVGRRFGDLTIDVDVDDPRPRDDRKPRRDKRSDRGDRGDRGGRRRSGGNEGGGNEKRLSEEQLRALARLAAEKAKKTGQTFTIKYDLNSYDRRIVHLEVAEIDGVGSRSEIGDDGSKVIKVHPEDGDE